MKSYLILFAMFVLLIVSMHESKASHDTSFPCNLSVPGQILPVCYNGAPRNNPDGTFYTGDSFYYVISYSTGPKCVSLKTHLVQTSGLNIEFHGYGPTRGTDMHVNSGFIEMIKGAVDAVCKQETGWTLILSLLEFKLWALNDRSIWLQNLY